MGAREGGPAPPPYDAIMYRLCCAALLGLLLLCATAWAEDPPAPTLTFDGRERGAIELRQLESAVRREIERVQASTAPSKDLLDALDAEAAALARGADLLFAIQDAPNTLRELQTGIAAAREALTQAQAEAAREVVLGPMDEARVSALEGQARQSALEAKSAADAVERRTAAVEQRKTEFDQSAARLATLATRGAEIAAALAKTPEDDVQARQLLAGQARRNEIRRGMNGLEQAHHDTLLTLDIQRRDLARIEAEVQATEQRTAEAVLARARASYRNQLEKAAADKEAETKRKLREAERAEAPAVKAIKRMEGLVGRMETERNNDLLQLSAIKSLHDTTIVLARVSKARVEALQVLFPRGSSLESWQREALAEQMRQLDQDEENYEEFRTQQLPTLLATRARVVTERGRVDVFQQRVELAQDRTDVTDLDRQLPRIRQELELSESENVRLWLQARLDFIEGQKQEDLSPDEVERLRLKWQETATSLKTVVQARAEDLRQTETTVGEVLDASTTIESGLAERRRHLDRIAFWLRATPLFSGAYAGDVVADVHAFGQRLAALPVGIGTTLEAGFEDGPARSRTLWSLGGFLCALLFGLWLRRRSAHTVLVTRPLADLDSLQGLLRGAALLTRPMVLPVLGLCAALLLRTQAPVAPISSFLLALAIAWCGFGLSAGLSAALFQEDTTGANMTRTDARTARGARRAMRMGLGGLAVFLGLGLVLEALSLPGLAHAVRLAWLLSVLGLGVWLLFRKDVLLAFFPADSQNLIVRTARSILPVAWPLAMVFGLVILVLDVLGYRTAAAFFAARAAWFALALIGIGIGHSLLRAWLTRHRVPEAEEAFGDAYDPTLAWRRILSRAAGQLLSLLTLAGIAVAIATVFHTTVAEWRTLAAVNLSGGGAGTGITLGSLFKAIVIFTLTILIAGHARDITRVVLRTRGKLEQGSRYAVRTLLFYLLIVIGFLIGLSALGLDMTQFGWFLTAAGLGIGFGLQEILSNLISGLILFFERPVQVGDVVSIGDVEGDVQQISIRSTIVRTRDGLSIILPNKRLITDEVINWSHGLKRTRLQVSISVAYGSNVDLVRSVLLQVAAQDPRVLRRPAPEVDFRAFGESELQFVLFLWLASPDISLRRRVRSDANVNIDRLFAENGITIPFPQRDLHIKSGFLPAPGNPPEVPAEPEAPAEPGTPVEP
jgi:small-conductance mechanosensitive channel